MDDTGALGATTKAPYEEVVVSARLALRASGIRILSEMPAPGGPQGRKHLFMGVWEAVIGTSNLGGEGLNLGDHLPLNFVVFEEGGITTVAALDPTGGSLEGWAQEQLPSAARAAVTSALNEAVTLAELSVRYS